MKDYKKILEGVMNIINTTEKSDIGFANICTYIGENCPELKESEDERVIRTLKEIVNWGCAKNISVENNVELKDCLAWLEKQGKKIEPIEGFNTEFERQVSHLIASSINKDYEYTAAYVKWVADALLNYAKQEIKKQGEQKLPIEKLPSEMKTIGESLGFTTQEDCDRYNQMVTDYIMSDDNGGQKPAAWSEEDEYMFNSFLHKLEVCGLLSNQEIIWIKNKFKSIKEQVQPQPKQEWSEEDYNEIETIACHLDNIDNEGMAEVLRNIRDKYCHIIPQTSWKPSDEQMQALSDAGNSFRPFEEGHKVLWSLYNDLKKLRGGQVINTKVGKDYKCKKNYKERSCSYTKGKIYHCSRDGYLNDDHDVSWSCSEEWFKEYLEEL